jgi:RNA polymerase primary sigma factor
MSLSTRSPRREPAVCSTAKVPARFRRDLGRRTARNGPRSIHAQALLTAEQERALAARIAGGDSDARDELVRANLGLVTCIARGYSGLGLDIEDLVGEGYVGLVIAAGRFDPRFNARFSTYAGLWIKQSIRQALGNTAAMIRLPIHAFILLNRWRRTARRLERTLGREPCFEEIAGALGLSEGRCRIVEQALHTRHHARPEGEHMELAAPAEDAFAGFEVGEQREDLRRRLGRLVPIERSVVTLRFGLEDGEPMTRKEIGRRLGCTREWIRVLEMRALAKMA